MITMDSFLLYVWPRMATLWTWVVVGDSTMADDFDSSSDVTVISRIVTSVLKVCEDAVTALATPEKLRGRAILMCCIFLLALLYTSYANFKKSAAKRCIAAAITKALLRLGLLGLYFYIVLYKPTILMDYGNYVLLVSIPCDVHALWILYMNVVLLPMTALMYRITRHPDDPRGRSGTRRCHLDKDMPRVTRADTNLSTDNNQIRHSRDTDCYGIFTKPVASRSSGSVNGDNIDVKMSTFIVDNNTTPAPVTLDVSYGIGQFPSNITATSRGRYNMMTKRTQLTKERHNNQPAAFLWSSGDNLGNVKKDANTKTPYVATEAKDSTNKNKFLNVVKHGWKIVKLIDVYNRIVYLDRFISFERQY